MVRFTMDVMMNVAAASRTHRWSEHNRQATSATGPFCKSPSASRPPNNGKCRQEAPLLERRKHKLRWDVRTARGACLEDKVPQRLARRNLTFPPGDAQIVASIASVMGRCSNSLHVRRQRAARQARRDQVSLASGAACISPLAPEGELAAGTLLASPPTPPKRTRRSFQT